MDSVWARVVVVRLRLKLGQELGFGLGFWVDGNNTSCVFLRGVINLPTSILFIDFGFPV